MKIIKSVTTEFIKSNQPMEITQIEVSFLADAIGFFLLLLAGFVLYKVL